MTSVPLPSAIDATERTSNEVTVTQACRATRALRNIRDLALPIFQWPRWRRVRPDRLSPTSFPNSSAPSSEMVEGNDVSTINTTNTTISNTNTEEETIFYLAYGSNLDSGTFEGKRGCKPISIINVAVPSLRLTFDLEGIPYLEPCFANTNLRDPNTTSLSPSQSSSITASATEKSPLLHPTPPDYHKDHWAKPLVGIVYELTPSDYAHVIATEGGGASYQDITVPCHPLLPAADTVPMHPTTPPFLAHTLCAPPGKRGAPPGRNRSYPQPSARYLKVITDGAAEHNLPREYRDYLAQIRPYKVTTQAQRLGQFLFMTIWAPLLFFIFSVQGLFADERGRSPEWFASMTAAIFEGVWQSYWRFFKGVFGDGERTIEDGGDGADDDDGKDGETRRKFVERAGVAGFVADEKQGGEIV